MNFSDDLFLIFVGAILGLVSSGIGVYWQHNLQLKRYEMQRKDDLERYELQRKDELMLYQRALRDQARQYEQKLRDEQLIRERQREREQAKQLREELLKGVPGKMRLSETALGVDLDKSHSWKKE